MCWWTFVFGPSTLILLIWVYQHFHLKVMLYLSKPYCVGVFVVFFSVYLFFGSIPLLQLACQLFQSIYSDPSYKILPTLSDKSLLHLFKPNCVAVFISCFFYSFFLGGWGVVICLFQFVCQLFSWFFGSNWWPISTYHMLWTYKNNATHHVIWFPIMILKLRFALHQNSSPFGLLPSYNNNSNNQASVPKPWSRLWILRTSTTCILFHHSILSIVMLFVAFLIYMLPLPFFHFLKLNQPTLPHWCINCSLQHLIIPSYVILPHLFINRSRPYLNATFLISYPIFPCH